MDSHVAALLAAIDAKTTVSAVVGQFIRIEQLGSIVVVSTAPGKAVVKCRPMSEYRPEPLELVVVLFIDGVAWYAGAAQTKPGRGTVATVAGGVATVSTDIGTVTASYDSLPTVADVVRLSWQDGPHIIGKVTVFPTQQPVPPDPVYVPIPHTFIFKANASGRVVEPNNLNVPPGTWFPGGYVVSATTYMYGFWFYGPQIKDTIPAGATITSVQMYFPAGTLLPSVSVSAPRNPAEAVIWTPNFTDPSFTPDVTISTSTSGAWFSMPIGLGAALAAAETSMRPNAGGLTSRMPGLDVFGDGKGDNLSGAVRITALY